MTAVTGNTGYHIVVVRGAAAGCVMAARVSEDGTRRVLLLEAGPDHRALPRGKLLGGCSSINVTFVLGGHPADYDAWAEAGNNGWSFDDHNARL